MGLDVLTPRGQEATRNEQEAAKLFRRYYPTYEYIETPKSLPAAVDGFMLERGVFRAAVEVKCRDCTLQNFNGQFGGQWLVTFEKIERARAVAVSMCVKLVGFLYLVPDQTLLVASITDETGAYMLDMKLSRTVTQRTVNGGQALRTNAYIDMRKAKVLN